MPTSTTQSRRDGEATRQRLLRAALELYTTIGFRATTTPAIAARAGVAEGTIYRHFSGKEHLLNEVFRNAQRWGAAWSARLRRARSAPDRLQPIARRLARDRGRRRAPRPDAAPPAGTSSTSTSGAGRPRASSAARSQRSWPTAGARRRVRSGPADLWTDVWLALVAFAAERVGAREWTPESPQIGLTLDAAWDAIAARA